MDTGSLADWASAAGSFGAVVTALYLAGSERRAARAAQRPELAIDDISQPDEDGWVTFRMVTTNHSTKEWTTRAITVLRPRGARIVEQSDCLDRTVGWDAKFDPTLRDKHASRRIQAKIRVRPSGEMHGGQAGDRSYRTFFVQTGGDADRLRLRIAFESFEPIADRYNVVVVRPLND